MHMSNNVLEGKKIKFHPDQPTSTPATAGLSERNAIRCPVAGTHFLKKQH